MVYGVMGVSSYSETSLALVEFRINELVSKKKHIEQRLSELIEIRDNIREEVIKEYEPCRRKCCDD